MARDPLKPTSRVDWDWRKFPANSNTKDEALDAIANYDTQAMLEIHNRYGLSSNGYCCATNDLIKFFNYAKLHGVFS